MLSELHKQGILQNQLQQQKMSVTQNKAGVVLMVLLFSFGIMFGNFGFPGTNQFSAITSTVPEVMPRIYQREEYKPVSNLQFDLLDEDLPANMVIRDRLRKKMVVDSPQAEIADVALLAKEEVPVKFNFDPAFFKANTTYLVCNSVHKLDPTGPLSSEMSDTGPKKLSFIIPPSSFSSNPDESQSKELLVVTCEVTDVAMLPLVETTA